MLEVYENYKHENGFSLNQKIKYNGREFEIAGFSKDKGGFIVAIIGETYKEYDFKLKDFCLIGIVSKKYEDTKKWIWIDLTDIEKIPSIIENMVGKEVESWNIQEDKNKGIVLKFKNKIILTLEDNELSYEIIKNLGFELNEINEYLIQDLLKEIEKKGSPVTDKKRNFIMRTVMDGMIYFSVVHVQDFLPLGAKNIFFTKEEAEDYAKKLNKIVRF